MDILYCKSKLFSGQTYQIIAVLAATISTISDGMHFGWTAPIIPILQSDNSPIPIQKSDIVWLQNIFMIGGFAGLPVTIFCVNKFGRKTSILMAAVQNLISWTLIAFSSSVTYFYIARFISGMASDVAFIVTPMYIAEIADQKIRGFLGAFVYVMLQIGIIVVYSVAPFMPIPYSSAIGASFLVLQLMTFSFMPESPYFLLLQDKPEEAKKSLQVLRSSQNVAKELNEMQAGIEQQSREKGRFIDLILVPSNRKALLILAVLNAAQHFSSFTVILMNLHTILGDADSILRPNTAGIVFSVILLIASISSATMMDKVGRKVLLSMSSVLTGVCLISLASYFNVNNSNINITTYNWIPLVAVIAFCAAFRCGLGMVPIVILAELFPINVKAMGMAISVAVYALFSIVSVYVYQELSDLYGMHIPFFLFALCCFLTAVFTIFYIPETKGKTLEEIQLILKGEKPTLIKRPLSTSQKLKGIIHEAPDITVL